MNKRRETVLKDERKKRKSIETEWKGSLTVEASCVMAVVLFSLAALIGKQGRSMMKRQQLWCFTKV